MAGRGRGVLTNVFGFVAQARAAATKALQGLRAEINATRKRLETLIAEERSFRLELFGTGTPGRPPAAGRPRKVDRSAGRKTAARKAGRREGPPKAEKFFAKLPKTFTIDDLRKVAGKAAPISLAQWSRAKKVRKVREGYEKA